MLKNQVQQLCNQDEAETPRSRCTRSGATPPIVREQVHKEAHGDIPAQNSPKIQGSPDQLQV